MLVRLLGSGGEGNVYEAVDQDMNKVAIKLSKNFRIDPCPLSRKIREVEIIQQLNSIADSAIVQTLDAFIAPDFAAPNHPCFFQVLEFGGLSLRDYFFHIGANGLLTLPMVKRIMFSGLRALAILEAADVMHRDIKPENLLIDPSTLSLKICDFGLARTDPNSDEEIHFDQMGRREGEFAMKVLKHVLTNKKRPRRLSFYVASTPYRAPEIAVGEKEYHCQSDVWSMGCVFVELLRVWFFQCRDEEVYNPLLFKANCNRGISPYYAIERRFKNVGPEAKHDLVEEFGKVFG